jgi:streptomycin 6-kinase
VAENRDVRALVHAIVRGPAFDWLEHEPGGTRWRASAPSLVAEVIERWSLELGEPFDDIFESVAFGAVGPDGRDAVLKVHFPNPENAHEADALATWGGDGAVRLLDRDDARGALLLERCRPGTPLSTLDPDGALDVFVDLLPRLRVPAGRPFRTLAEEAARWVATLEADWERAGRPFSRRYLDIALEALTALPPTQGEQALIHQDLQGDNVLAAERRPWLAIDPKPLVGEGEFAVAPIVRGAELGHERRLVLRRLDHLTAELGLDRERARLWTVAQTVAWSVGSEYPPEHLEVVRWLLEP